MIWQKNTQRSEGNSPWEVEPRPRSSPTEFFSHSERSCCPGAACSLQAEGPGNNPWRCSNADCDEETGKPLEEEKNALHHKQRVAVKNKGMRQKSTQQSVPVAPSWIFRTPAAARCSAYRKPMTLRLET